MTRPLHVIAGEAELPITEGFTPAVPSSRRQVWRRFAANKMALAGLIVIIILVLAAIFAPWITKYSYSQTSHDTRLRPSWEHWFGTDRLGRDMFTRVVYGARVSLKIGILATAISMFIGVLFGAIAGFFGGFADTVIMRLTDIFLAIPYIVLAVAIAGRASGAARTRSSWSSASPAGWRVARIVRSSFLSLKQARVRRGRQARSGSAARGSCSRHILPNVIQPIIVYGTLGDRQRRSWPRRRCRSSASARRRRRRRGA